MSTASAIWLGFSRQNGPLAVGPSRLQNLDTGKSRPLLADESSGENLEFAADPDSEDWAAVGRSEVVVNGVKHPHFLDRLDDKARPDLRAVDIAGARWIAAGPGAVVVDGEPVKDDRGRLVELNWSQDDTQPDAKVSKNTRHWIAAGSKGVMKDGVWLKDRAGESIKLKTYSDRSPVEVALSADGQSWLAAGREGVIIDGTWLQDAEGARITPLNSRDTTLAADLSENGESWIVATPTAILVNGEEFPAVTGYGDGSPAAVDLSEDGSSWIAVGSNGIIKDGEWLTDSLGERLKVHGRFDREPISVALSDDGRRWAAAGPDGVLIDGFWKAEREQMQALYDADTGSLDIEFEENQITLGDHTIFT